MKIYFSPLAAILLLLILSSCNYSTQPKENGFDQICRIYTDVFDDAEKNALSVTDRYEIINERIISSVHSPKALEVYSAIKLADPEKKYALFKESAEVALEREWNCSIMQQLK